MTRVGAGLSGHAQAVAAAREAGGQAESDLAGARADLAFLFLTPHHLHEAAEAAAAVAECLQPGCLLGCVSSGVIGREREIESGPAASVLAVSFSGDASLTAFHLPAHGAPEELGELSDLAQPELVALVADPFSVRGGRVIELLEEEHPGVPVVGGFATGGGRPGTQALILDGQVYSDGIVGVGLEGVRAEAIVSQGCAPLGQEAVITRAEENVVFELAGRPALTRLREIVGALPPDAQALAARGPLLAGLVIDENRPEYGPGDFLVRGILGADEETGAIAIGENVRVGQTLRFHVRDADSAHRDLERMLAERLSAAVSRPAGALLFTCNGRGAGMFGDPDHDSRALSAALGAPALAGFFCGGEIGPVGRRTFVHGFTATMAVFH